MEDLYKDSVKNVINELRKEISCQSLDDSISNEELVANTSMILELIDDIDILEDNKLICVEYHPMGSLHYEIIEE